MGGIPMTTNERTVGRYLRWLLAALSLGAGVIHFSVSGEHYNLSWLHGGFFAVVAWLQLAWAVGVILRPSRRLLIAGVVFNAGIIGVWAMSRIWGVPVGPGAWTPEAVTLADALSSGFEAGIVVLSLAVLVRPALASQRLHPSFAAPSFGLAALAIAVVSSLAVAPAFASSDHQHSDTAAGGNAVAEGHSHAATAGAAVTNTPCNTSGPPASAGQVEHGHRGPAPWAPISDSQQRTAFEQEVGIAHQVTVDYPTVQDAEAAGYHMVTPYVPCIGAHYINIGHLIGKFDYAHPAMLLYDGTNPDSKIVGLSYATFGDPNKQPDTFEGRAPWHKHNKNGGLCLKGLTVVGAEGISAEKCAQREGHKIKLDNLWMMHMWIADGWPSSWGLFSSEHPDLGGAIGDINGKPDPKKAKALADGGDI
jgi:hypothetical protein